MCAHHGISHYKWKFSSNSYTQESCSSNSHSQFKDLQCHGKSASMISWKSPGMLNTATCLISHGLCLSLSSSPVAGTLVRKEFSDRLLMEGQGTLSVGQTNHDHNTVKKDKIFWGSLTIWPQKQILTWPLRINMTLRTFTECLLVPSSLVRG